MKDTVDSQTKGQLFLDYVATNEKDIKKAVKKNITWESDDFFNDVYYEFIVKAYDSIIKNNTDIKDLKNFCFISFKNLHIIRQGQLRKRQSMTVDVNEAINVLDDLFDCGEEERFKQINVLLSDLKMALSEEFGTETSQMFLEYINEKVANNTNYDKIAEKYGITSRNASQKIKECRRFLLTNEELNNKYQNIINNADPL